MDQLFGISTQTLATACIIITAIILGILIIVALRNPVMFKLGLRNIPRRKTQTALIIFGLMLATVIITTAFSTGDTVSNSATKEIYSLLGETDEVIQWNRDDFPRPIDEQLVSLEHLDTIIASLKNDPDIEGYLPVLAEQIPIRSRSTGLNETKSVIVSYPSDAAKTFGGLIDISGNPVNLSGNQIAINTDLADAIDGKIGDELDIFVNNQAIPVVVIAIVPKSVLSGTFDVSKGNLPGGAVALDLLGPALGLTGYVQAVLVTNTGDRYEGMERTDVVTEKIEAVIAELYTEPAGNPGEIDPSIFIKALKKNLSTTSEGTALLKDIEKAFAAPELADSQDIVTRLENLLPNDRSTKKMILTIEQALTELASSTETGPRPDVSEGVSQALVGRSSQNIAALSKNELPLYTVMKVKQDSIQIADIAASIFTTIFLIIGLFSIAAGILLIFLIFIMLTSERKPEMGMARAVGARRSHLIESYLAEGMGYDIGSAVVGLFAGIGVTYVMIALLNNVGNALPLPLTASFSANGLIISFCLGIIVTFLVVVFAAARASRINIVAAIRDIPEETIGGEDSATINGYLHSITRALVGGGYIVAGLLLMLRFGVGTLPILFLIVGAIGIGVHSLLGTNYGASLNERTEGGLPKRPLLLLPAIPIYLISALLVKLTRDRRRERFPFLLQLIAIIFPPLGVVVVAMTKRERTTAWSVGYGSIGLFIGIILFQWIWDTPQLALFTTGVSLFFLWVAVSLRYFEIKERITFTIIPILLLIFWYLTATDAYNWIVGELDGGPELMFVSGLVMVTAATMIILYNAEIALPLVSKLRFGRIMPAVKTAVAYPLRSRLRTGMTLMMIGLITFALVMVASMNTNFAQIFLSDDAKGGFDIQVQGNPETPIQDLRETLTDAGVRTDKIENISRIQYAAFYETEIKPREAEGRFYSYGIMGVDDEFLQINTLEIEQFAQGYNSSQEVWEALRTNPNFAVIPHGMTTGTNRFADANLLTLEPLVDNFEPFEISLRNKATQEIVNVTVIAKTNTAGDSFGVFMDEMRASGAMIINNTVFKTVLPDADLEYFYLQTSKGIDTDKLAKTIESALVQVSAESLQNLLDDERATATGFLLVLQGFMGLGLIVGIAALGVISFRAVVERRQQIGMLRAIGYQRAMIALSFLLESGFIALVGIALGLILGITFSWSVIASGGIPGTEGASFVIPWRYLIVIASIAFAASLVMTYFPARQASKVEVAEALRYE